MDTKYLEIIKAPVITEKSQNAMQNGQYTFKVDPKANKTEIKTAIEKLFNVKVVKISTINEKPKKEKSWPLYRFNKPFKESYRNIS